MLRQPEYITFRLPWPPTYEHFPPTVYRWKVSSPLGSNTKLFWGKKKKECLVSEADGPRSHFALSGSGRKAVLGPASSFPRARAEQGWFKTVSFSLQDAKVFPHWIWPRSKKVGLGHSPVKPQLGSIQAWGSVLPRRGQVEREGGLSRKAHHHLLGGVGGRSLERRPILCFLP